MNHNIIAHRGYHNSKMNIPENSILAFKRAIRNKYIIELDVHITKDNKIVIFHDFSLKRLFNVNKLVENCTYNELLNYSFPNTNQKIPLLKSVLNIVNGSVPIIIEIKSLSFNGKLEKELCKIIDNYNGLIYVQSFNILSILWFRINKKKIKRGIIYSSLDKKTNILKNNIIKQILFNTILKLDFISCNKDSLNDNYIVKLRKKIPIFSWTIKNREEYDLYQRFSDKLICDNIDDFLICK